MYICKNKNYWTAGNGQIHGINKGDKDWSIGGGNGELIFIEITEFDLDHKGWLMCMEERKWGKVIYHLFIQQIYLEPLLYLGTVLGTGHTVENKVFVLMGLTF